MEEDPGFAEQFRELVEKAQQETAEYQAEAYDGSAVAQGKMQTVGPRGVINGAMAIPSSLAMGNSPPPRERKDMADDEELQDALKQIEEASRKNGSSWRTSKRVVDGLRSSRNEYKVKLEGSGAGAEGQNAIAVGERGVLIRRGNGNFINTGNVQGNVYYGKQGRNRGGSGHISIGAGANYRASAIAWPLSSSFWTGCSPDTDGPGENLYRPGY